MIDVEEIRGLSRRLRRSAPALRELGAARVAAALEQASALLLDGTSLQGRALRARLLERSGLSAAMIEWGLSTTLSTVRADSMLTLVEQARIGDTTEPPDLAVAILAGNVFTAGVRAVVLPLLAGTPVLAKGSSSEDALPRHLKAALTVADPDVGRSYEVVTFSHDNERLRAALVGHADLVSVYGSDSTVDAVREFLAPGTRVVSHGHGLGVAYVAGAANVQDTLERLALDVAAYDQRGCLSPHVVLVERGRIGAEGFAAALAAEPMRQIQQRLPRGEMGPEVAAQQMQWRGVAASRGRLYEGSAWAVSYEGSNAPRQSPTMRNVAVYDCDDLEQACALFGEFGHHLKCVGIAPEADVRDRISRHTTARVCAVGEMQTPGLHEHLDGLHPLDGLLAGYSSSSP